jgi:hypothetical protein
VGLKFWRKSREKESEFVSKEGGNDQEQKSHVSEGIYGFFCRETPKIKKRVK